MMICMITYSTSLLTSSNFQLVKSSQQARFAKKSSNLPIETSGFPSIFKKFDCVKDKPWNWGRSTEKNPSNRKEFTTKRPFPSNFLTQFTSHQLLYRYFCSFESGTPKNGSSLAYYNLWSTKELRCKKCLKWSLKGIHPLKWGIWRHVEFWQFRISRR